ncbi:hypothetical protein RJ639_046885 [Escallonia herrerae]|uniref:RRM domain-containing protein n=1 Tax=Escallonia herrerae TaxID=1293975 RepID=A0AA89B1L6_9ASTE|nr:hypothetical protein RJ639_046885 [Escallonia herrerae]
MADAYWRYNEGRQQAAFPPPAGKRPRSDYDIPGGHEMPGYMVRDDERGAHRVLRDTDSIGASYDRFLRNAQLPSYAGGEPARQISGALGSRPVDDPRMMGSRPVDDPRMMGIGGSDPAATAKGRSMVLSGGRPEVPLPPDASSTLFVEGLPANCSRREVAHIFRPFVGYKEVRLVTKDSRHPGGDPLVLCFVDFLSPAHAATALDALQGYVFDEHDRDPVSLRLQFARYPGARSGGGHRGKR